MKTKPKNEAVTSISMKERCDLHGNVAEFFRKRGIGAIDYRQRGAAVIKEIKRRKALELTELTEL